MLFPAELSIFVREPKNIEKSAEDRQMTNKKLKPKQYLDSATRRIDG